MNEDQLNILALLIFCIGVVSILGAVVELSRSMLVAVWRWWVSLRTPYYRSSMRDWRAANAEAHR